MVTASASSGAIAASGSIRIDDVDPARRFLLVRARPDHRDQWLTNRLITVTGFTLAGGGGVDLGRVVIICCAADAQLARIHLSGPEVSGLAVLPEQTWLRVEGVVIPTVPEGDSTAVPTMEVHQATRIEAPANVYA